MAREGDPKAFRFAKPSVGGFDYSFSGLKTSFLYFLRDRVADDPDFIENTKPISAPRCRPRSSKS